jgi:hypothetical protein
MRHLQVVRSADMQTALHHVELWATDLAAAEETRAGETRPVGRQLAGAPLVDVHEDIATRDLRHCAGHRCGETLLMAAREPWPAGRIAKGGHMSLIWKDELASVLIGIAAVLYLLWAGGTPVLGLSGPRGAGRRHLRVGNRGVLHGQITTGV